jgi:hypothetical protein
MRQDSRGDRVKFPGKRPLFHGREHRSGFVPELFSDFFRQCPKRKRFLNSVYPIIQHAALRDDVLGIAGHLKRRLAARGKRHQKNIPSHGMCCLKTVLAEDENVSLCLGLDLKYI